MRRLFEVDLKDYEGCSKVFRRPSARAIIFMDDKIALVYAANEKYYKFPGGGIHDDEDKKKALAREVKEEVGLVVIPESITEYGSVLRRQKSDREENTVFEQEASTPEDRIRLFGIFVMSKVLPKARTLMITRKTPVLCWLMLILMRLSRSTVSIRAKNSLMK